MGLTELVAGLDSYLRTAEKELEALRSLLQNGRISQSTYELVEKKVARKRTLVFELKEALITEEDYWRNSISGTTRILERLLVELEHRYILGEIGDDELEYKSGTISLGLTSLTGKTSPPKIVAQEPAQPIQTTLQQQTLPMSIPEQEMATVEEPVIVEESPNVVEEEEPEPAEEELKAVEEEPLPEEPVIEEPIAPPATVEEPEVKPVQPKKPSNGGQAAFKRKKPSAKDSSEADPTYSSAVRCMNPWKPDCRSTDIGLSIYYKGHSVPICHKCWEEISEKNIEWEN